MLIYTSIVTLYLTFKFSVHGMIMRASSWKRQLAVPWTMKEREGPRPAYKPAARLCGRRHQRTNERQWQTEKSLCDWDLGYANHSLDCKLSVCTPRWNTAPFEAQVVRVNSHVMFGGIGNLCDALMYRIQLAWFLVSAFWMPLFYLLL